MKTLHTLIRFKKMQLDELRRKLAALENQKQQLLTRSAEMADELKKELQLATTQTEMSGFFGNFADRIKHRQEDIAKRVRDLDKQMDSLAEEIRQAYGEVKKYEIVRDRRIEEKRQSENKKEEHELDAIGAGQHERKKK